MCKQTERVQCIQYMDMKHCKRKHVDAQILTQAKVGEF